MSRAEFDSAKSLYKQIKQKLKERILAGEYKTGEQIPSERELCEMFGVSRITVRQAINEAVNEGLLYKVQGKGTFISGSSDQIINQGLVKLTSFGNTFAGRGMTAATKILGHKVQQADFGLSKILKLDIVDQVFVLELLGLANEYVMVLYRSFYPIATGMRVYREALKLEEKEKAFSTIDLYRDFSDLKPAYVEQTFEAMTADGQLAETLQLNPTDPLFLVNSIFYTRGDEPMEYRQAYYRADKYKFHIKREIM